MQKVQFHPRSNAFRRAKQQLRRDRGLAIAGVTQLARLQHERAWNDACQDGQSVDPGIKDAEATCLPDPGLAGMPDTDILLPIDSHATNVAVCEPGARRLDCGRMS